MAPPVRDRGCVPSLVLRARRLELALVLGLAGGCSHAPEAPEGYRAVDLLARGLDGVLDQPGRIHPPDPRDWYAVHYYGWADHLEGESIWTVDTFARLPLHATLPRDRTLRITMHALAPTEMQVRRGNPEREATVTLNGTVLGEVTLGEQPKEFVFDAPAELWSLGVNVLELGVDAITPTEYGRRGIGLDALTYDETLEVRREDDEVRLDGGTGLRVRVMADAESTIRIGGDAKGEGELVARFRSVDPFTGAAVESGATEDREPVRIVAAGRERIGGALPLPPDAHGLLELELLWRADSSTPLELDELTWIVPLRERPRPPIVFVSIDTLAAEHMSVYGYARETTPHLERFAVEAITFDACRANAPRTMPSYLSQFTGLYPTANRTPFEGETERWLTPREEAQLTDDRTSLAEALRATGYRTAAWVDNMVLVETPGIEQGFDVFDVEAANLPHWTSRLPEDPNGWQIVAEKALDWIEDVPRGEPFFAFVQALDVHGPYFPKRPWRGRFAQDETWDRELVVPSSLGQADVFGYINYGIAKSFAKNGVIPKEMNTAALIDAYDEKILEIDERIDDFFDELRDLDVYDDAIIVVSADHGESTVKHEFYFAHGLLTADTLHVPLMIRMPGGAGGGRRIATPVQLVDLYPTLLELAGAPVDAVHTHGRSLAAALRGGGVEPRPLIAEGGILHASAIELDGWKLSITRPAEGFLTTQLTHPAVRDELVKRWPALLDPALSRFDLQRMRREDEELAAFLDAAFAEPRVELFDLANDPNETTDVLALHPERAAELRRLLEIELDKARAAHEVGRFASGASDLSDEDLERLKALGYLGED